MELRQIKLASEVPTCLQSAAKVALAVGAKVFVSNDDAALMVEFAGSDKYYFDPQNVTMHALEVVQAAQRHGIVVQITCQPNGVVCSFAKHHFIGFSASESIAPAMRQAIVGAFSALYHDAHPET